MRSLEWRGQMKHAPKLAHSAGMVVMQLGAHSVLFPSEADAHFFVAAYNDVANLAGEVSVLRAWIDEGALVQAQARNTELIAEVERLRAERVELQTTLAVLAEKAATATQRARTLAHALLRKTP